MIDRLENMDGLNLSLPVSQSGAIAQPTRKKSDKSRRKLPLSWLKKSVGFMMLFAAIAGIGTVGAMRLNPQAETEEATPTEVQPAGLPVRVVPAQSAPIQAWVFSDGFASAVRSKHLTFEVPGTITYIKKIEGRDLREGDRVREGELLAKVDDRKLAADITQAQAGTAEAQTQRSVAVANLEQARANLQQAKAGVEQNQALLEQSRSKVEQARANLAQIQSRVQQAQVGVQQAEAKVEQAQANVAQTQARQGQSLANLARSQANLQKAQADLDLAIKEQERRLTLYQEGVISQSDLDVYTNRRQNAESGLNAAQNEVKAAEQEVEAANSQIIAAQKEVEAAKSQVSAALQDVEVAKSQVTAGEQEIAVAQSQVTVAHSQISAAESQVKAVAGQVQSAQAQIYSADAGIASAQTQVTRADVNLEDSAIYAPFDGVLAYLNITEGDYWSPQRVQASGEYQNIVERVPMIIIDPGEFEVNVELPAFEGDRVRPGQRVYIVLDEDMSAASAGQMTSDQLTKLARAEGQVFSVSPSVTPGGRAMSVTMRIKQGSENLRHGSRVSAWIAVEENPNATIAPFEAFVFRDRQPHVFVVNPETGRVEQREITLGIEGISTREIVEGVNPGELLVTEGSNRLVDGAPVEIVEGLD
ncbi:HlyD family efflux transporter periplasmic adaptor subunit [Oscillatoria sp. HE19RPO]|uniref:HlyD family efflux transporter periplasmic adaptor subunit n=1 Tax=Oscillatoria sp. HE19RPO TaxID=2954806 RepID=UPI0020C2FE2D|nr:HlyD family efflux transporter periplasmic adaptor subunit [Oscillatoria sp. HE19RPO]